MDRLLDLLARLGRYGTQGFAVSLAVGLAVPPLAALARPLLPLCILAFIVLTFAPADFARARASLRRPGPLAAASLWLLLVPVALTAALVRLGGDALDPGVRLGLALVGAAPPIFSGPAVAALVGLDPTLLLGATLATTVLAPLLSPPLAELILGAAVPLDRAALAGRLALLIGGGFALALLWRRVVGAGRIAARARAVDGAGVVIYGVFAVAAMDGIAAATWAEPARAAVDLGLVLAVAVASLALSLAALRFLPPGDRLLFGYSAGQRNMSILVAALGAAVPPSTYLFFALAQFPIYLLPTAIRALVPRVRRPRGGTAPAGLAPDAAGRHRSAVP